MSGLKKYFRQRLPERLDKDSWATFFVEWPLIQLLIFTPVFRIAFILSLAGLVSLVLALLPIWRTSPEGVEPVITITGIRWLQSRALQASGERASANEQFDKAHRALVAAWSHNPGSPELTRSVLVNDLRARTNGMKLEPKLNFVPWLLRVTQTNRESLEMAVRVLQLDESWSEIKTLLALLAPLRTNLPPNLLTAYEKALFHSGNLAQFNTLWPAAAVHLEQDPELQIYKSAYDAISDRKAFGDDWTTTVFQTLTNPSLKRVICQLDIKVADYWDDPQRYEQALAQLSVIPGHHLQENIGLWTLLWRLGQRDQAQAKASAFFLSNAGARPLFYLAEALAHLDLPEQALKILDHCITLPNASDKAFILRCDLLQMANRWDELMAAAASLRESRRHLAAYGHLLEGIVHLKEGRTVYGELALDRIQHAAFGSYGLSLPAAQKLVELNYPQPALQLLTRIKSQATDDPIYWRAYASTATALRDSDLLLEAASALQRIQPKHPVSDKILTTALLSGRSDPAEAVQRTEQWLKRTTNLISARINHALALNANGRYPETEALLKEIDPKTLPEPVRLYWLYAQFDLKAHANQTNEARSLYAQIDQSQLFTAERAYLEKVYQEKLGQILP